MKKVSVFLISIFTFLSSFKSFEQKLLRISKFIEERMQKISEKNYRKFQLCEPFENAIELDITKTFLL